MKNIAVMVKKVVGMFIIEEYVFTKKDSSVDTRGHMSQEKWIKMFATLR